MTKSFDGDDHDWSSYLEAILRARVYDLAVETPLDFAPTLSEKVGNSVYLKREDLQPVFSFKIRGAYNKIASLSASEKSQGIIATSAGNHAQGVAMSAKHLGISAVIVMPITTPRIKVDAVKRLGAEVILSGVSYDDAKSHAEHVAEDRNLTYVHPFDDPHVIAGQGTIALEIFRQTQEKIDAVFVSVGGGGLISGVAAYIKSLWPEVKVIGVEPSEAPTMYESLRCDERVMLSYVGGFADGVAVKQVGSRCFSIAKDCVDEMVLVSTDEICAAIRDIFDDTRSIAEPAGALGVAGLKKYCNVHGKKGENYVAINCGANVNFDKLRYIAERAETGENREVLLAVTIDESPGTLKKFCEVIGKRSITEFNYRYSDRRNASIFVGLEVFGGIEARHALVNELRDDGFRVVDITDNELAKLHIRYMVGGRPSEFEMDEAIYRFEFPEQPGALLHFLSQIGKSWNISMFHYRNHGASVGRVLVGLQVPEGHADRIADFLDRVGYQCIDETENPAYSFFLA